MVSAWPTVPVGTQTITVHQTVLQAVTELFRSAREAGIDNLFISSGFRDYAEQQELYVNAADRSFVLPPGHSEHHTGLAVDILATGIRGADMSSSREGQWLVENAWQFGLILRYPNGKQHITGVAYEPWHFRYVGKPHAWYMHEHNLVLEEYIRFLQENGSYTTTLDGITYYVLYETPQNGMISIPENMNFRISGDNTGGYIITAWR